MKSRFDPPMNYYEPPEPTPPPRCPVCGAETDTYMRDHYGNIVGCDECIENVDAWDWREEHDG